MSQHHQGYQPQQEVHRDLRYHKHHVIPNTSSSSLTHGTGHAATNGHSSSFQTPGQAVSSSPFTPPVGDQSRVPSFSSSNQHPAAAAPSQATRPMGSKPSSPLPPQSLTSGIDPVLDAGQSTTKGMNVAGGKLKRAFGAKRKESNDPYSLASKGTSSETIAVSKSISSSLRPSEYAPDSMHSSITSTAPQLPPSQVLDKYLVTPPSNSTSLSQSSAAFSGPTKATSGRHPKSSSPPAAAGNRNSVIAVSPGISSAINFMMMECQDPSAPRLVVNTSSPSLPSGVAESSKPSENNESQKEKETVRRRSGGPVPTSPDKREMKESWRKSDSTNSHHTVRANSLRASRPVSWAESFHSAYTIVPANGQGPSSRRLSGLIADVNFGVREEEVEEDLDATMEYSSSPSRHFATSNFIQDPDKDGNLTPGTGTTKMALLKKAKRRSISLSSALPDSVGGLFTGTKPLQPEPPVATIMPVPAFPSAGESRKVSYSISGMDSFRNASYPHVHTHSRQRSENVLHKRPPIPSHSVDLTHHVPSMMLSTSQLTSGSRSTQDNPPQQSNLKGKLQPFSPPLLPGVPPDYLNSLADPARHAQTRNLPPAISASHSSHIRQPTLSSLGPSAAGIAKRAVERMGKRLGDMMNLSSSSNTSVSGHSSSTSISTFASTSVTSGTSLIPSPLVDGKMQQSQGQGPSAFVPGRTASRGSNPSSPKGSGHGHHHSMIHNFLPGPSKSGHKRLQKPTAMGEAATSGNLSSTSESDPFSSTGSILGRRLRGPIKKGNIFGKELRIAVKETRVVVRDNGGGVDVVEGSSSKKVGLIKALECRVLPAVVARCAQHLLIWGVQEQGLFRVNGHPRHVSHLRAEFDSGADYDMTECSPSELDPHAVASVFKAYLRELPDSILTQKLQAYFDAAINKENSMPSHGSKFQQPSIKSHQGLPSCPRDVSPVSPVSLRKPPSLSTLAMPSFNNVPLPSRSLINAFRSLIAQLPPENRDLLRTVVDLIKATAKGSKATKMPLSNLLLLFCPSLNMSPPLLRLLCETEGIWEEERTYLLRCAEEDRMVESDAEPPVSIPSNQNPSAPRDEDETDARSGFDEASSLRSGRASSDNPSSLDYHASAEEDSLFSEERALRRRDIAGRPEIPTVYLDTLSHLSSSSGSLLQDAPETHRHTGSFLVRQEMPDDGSISPYTPNVHHLLTSPSLPLLSSSADSVSSNASSPSVYNFPLDDGRETERSDTDLPSGSAEPSPQFLVVEPLEIRKRPLISNPIPITGPVQYPFPTSRSKEHVSNTPSRRRSIPLLSLSSLSSRSSGSPSPSPLGKNSPYHAESRTKKTSLKLLFSKKSSSSLLEDKERPIIRIPFLHPPEPHFHQDRASPRSGSGSDSSISTPLSAVTAPQGSGFFSFPGGSQEGPPVLNTLIEDSSLKFDELMDPENDLAKSIMDAPSLGRMDLSPPLISSTTKIATSRSITDDPVSHSKPALSNLRPSPPNRLPSSQPRNEEWMRSVLMAADADLPSRSKFQ